jgi:hypothetical protein
MLAGVSAHVFGEVQSVILSAAKNLSFADAEEEEGFLGQNPPSE